MVKTDMVSLPGLNMRYASFGAGQKNFVIIPGLSVKPVTLAAQAVAMQYSMFAEKYTVYLFDRRENAGHGYTVKDMADDTAAAMQYLGIEQADIFGTSQGGMIAMYIAALYPAMVNRMVLGSTTHIISDESYKLFGEWKRLALEHREKELIEKFAGAVYSEQTLKNHRDVIFRVNTDISDSQFEQFAVMIDSMNDLSLKDHIDKIHCDTLVAGSEGDRVFGCESSLQLAEVLGAKLVMYGSGFGHAVYDEAPDYTQKVYEFLQES